MRTNRRSTEAASLTAVGGGGGGTIAEGVTAGEVPLNCEVRISLWEGMAPPDTVPPLVGVYFEA